MGTFCRPSGLLDASLSCVFGVLTRLPTGTNEPRISHLFKRRKFELFLRLVGCQFPQNSDYGQLRLLDVSNQWIDRFLDERVRKLARIIMPQFSIDYTVLLRYIQSETGWRSNMNTVPFFPLIATEFS